MATKFAGLRRRGVIAAGTLAPFWPACAGAQDRPGAEILIPVLRETVAKNTQNEALTPVGPMRVTDAQGKEHTVELAAFDYIGDMHIRFVFDAPRRMLTATPKDFARLNLSGESALTLAINNLKRLYGTPTSKAFIVRIMEVVGKEPNFNSSYFLDRAFWQQLAQRHPEGLVAGVPRRGHVIYTPVTDAESVAALRGLIGKIHVDSEDMRISSGLYLFKNDRWTVFQPPVGGGR
jgi:hypothetical protein